MVESKSQRDILVDSRIAYIGDDTGLIKKVKVVAKRVEETQTIDYAQTRYRKKVDDQGNEILIKKRPGALNASDN
jgi:hypothetical protein